MLGDPRPLRLALDPLDDYVVIEPTDEEAETRAGLIIPASAEADGISPGDKVLFPREAGYDVRLAGTAVKVVRRRELIARIQD